MIETSKDYGRRFLIDKQVAAGLSPDIEAALSKDPKMLKAAAMWLLESNFPDTIHEDILSAVGLNLKIDSKKQRDPQFRERILVAYAYSCAVCGYGIRLGEKLVGVEAAHIKWHRAGGPDIENNGIALCSLHHKLLTLVPIQWIDN